MRSRQAFQIQLVMKWSHRPTRILGNVVSAKVKWGGQQAEEPATLGHYECEVEGLMHSQSVWKSDVTELLEHSQGVPSSPTTRKRSTATPRNYLEHQVRTVW